MLFSRNKKVNRKRQSAWLYSTVFNGLFSTVMICFLFVSFLIQPFHKAIASEAIPEAPVEEAPVAADVQPQEEVSNEQVLPEDVTPQEELVVEDQITAPSDTEVTPEPSGEDGTEVASTEPETTSDTGMDDGTSDEETSIDSSPITVEDMTETPQESATSTEGSVVQLQSLITEENYFQFSKQSCIEVGGGAYHCTNKDVEGIDTQSSVYAAIGGSGNMEIFLKTTKGKIKQITDNSYDDTSPNYDPESMRLVWQRLIDGRYQIILYDIAENDESQLTFSRTNNMEPKISDTGIVWQAWDNNDWEIMLFDGQYTEQLTDNETQDVAPVIQDGYVLWNVLGGTEQQARVYSLSTKETTPITGYEGGSIINPRFVLVYDTEYENGDIVTQSFDPTTGLSEPIAAKPVSEPIDIPENDPTGEIRALLIQGKSQKEEHELTDLTDGGNTEPIATSTPGTLDLKAPGDAGNFDAVIAPATTTDPAFELTEYDLVIPEGALEAALNAQ